MDYRNDNRTPRDRVDEEFFRAILRDEDSENEMHRTGSRMNDSHMNEYRMRDSRMNNSRMRDSHMHESRMNDSHSRDSRMQDHRQGSRSQEHSQDCCAEESRMSENRRMRSNNCPMTSWQNECLSDFPLGMVYSPPQSFTGIMDVPDAFSAGTIFTGLDLPFNHSGCKGEMCR